MKSDPKETQPFGSKHVLGRLACGSASILLSFGYVRPLGVLWLGLKDFDFESYFPPILRSFLMVSHFSSNLEIRLTVSFILTRQTFQNHLKIVTVRTLCSRRYPKHPRTYSRSIGALRYIDSKLPRFLDKSGFWLEKS